MRFGPRLGTLRPQIIDNPLRVLEPRQLLGEGEPSEATALGDTMSLPSCIR
jgi:hypothetical protein